MDREELRRLRLRNLETGTATEPQEKRRQTGESSNISNPSGMRGILEQYQFMELRKIIVGDNVTSEDMSRWYSQGFVFCEEPVWGLKQGHGGPCGILASVQAEILNELCFGEGRQIDVPTTSIPSCTVEDMIRVFARAIVRILNRAKGDETKIALVNKIVEGPVSDSSSANEYVVYEMSSEEETVEYIIENYESYRSVSGVIIFLMSLVLTRGVQNIKKDMDDEFNSMIGQFGHSSQDLINLLLTGMATSNIFDGTMPMGDSGMMLKGILQRNDIGYLTQLEALRYCQVGSYYKIPERPIWVVGSSSHFTVLFSLSRCINEESEQEKLLSRVQRAFKAVDVDECGFIAVDKLQGVLKDLNIDFADDGTCVARLRGHLQVDGGIIIWSTFWENISRLMSGTALDDLFVSQSHNSQNVQTMEGRVRSDSDYARELEEGFNGASSNDSKSSVQMATKSNETVANSIASLDFSSLLDPLNSMDKNKEAQSRPRSDSDIAKELQKQFDEGAEIPDLVPIDNEEKEMADAIAKSIEDFQQTQSHDNKLHRTDSIADDSGEGLHLYHFNGLEAHGRPARLSKFLLFKRTSDNAVGQSIAFSGGESCFANSHLEEVIR